MTSPTSSLTPNGVAIHVVDIAASALGGGQMAGFDIQPTDMCRGRKVHGGISGRELVRV